MGQALKGDCHCVLVHAVLVEIKGDNVLLLRGFLINRLSFISVAIGRSVSRLLVARFSQPRVCADIVKLYQFLGVYEELTSRLESL